jgi:ATP/maltotriose-dependent transcriptional regulator MalT
VPEAFAAAWSELLAHHPCSAESVYGAWVGLESPDRIALAAEFLVARGAMPVAERLANDALVRIGHGDAATRVRVLLVLARIAETAGRLTEAAGHCAEVARVAATAAGSIRALAAANSLRLDFLCNGPSVLRDGVATIRQLVTEYPDGRALATVLLVEGLAALDGGDIRAARARFDDMKRISLRDDDLAGSAAAEAGLARADFARGRRRSAECRARTVEAVGELLGDGRIVLEGLAIRTAVATDDVARFAEAHDIIELRRRRAAEMNDQIALIEADMDEAILLAGKGALREKAHRLAARALDRTRSLGLRRLEQKITGITGGTAGDLKQVSHRRAGF